MSWRVASSKIWERTSKADRKKHPNFSLVFWRSKVTCSQKTKPHFSLTITWQEDTNYWQTWTLTQNDLLYKISVYFNHTTDNLDCLMHCWKGKTTCWLRKKKGIFLLEEGLRHWRAMESDDAFLINTTGAIRAQSLSVHSRWPTL